MMICDWLGFPKGEVRFRYSLPQLAIIVDLGRLDGRSKSGFHLLEMFERCTYECQC